MNSANNPAGIRGGVGLVVLAALLLAVPAKAEEPVASPGAVSATPTPISEAGSGTAIAGTIEVAEPPDNEEVLELLRSGNNGKPLTVAQMSAINDMIKRMEFLADIEKKMQSIELGGGSLGAAGGPASVAAMPAPVPGGLMPGGGGDSGGVSILRIIGNKGQYAAVLSTGGSSPRVQTVRPGDETDFGRISKVTMDGVLLVTSEGSVKTLPFSSPPGTANLLAGR